MKVILVRSRSIDSAVFKLAKTLSENGHTVTLLVWDRQNNLKDENNEYNIHKFSLTAPYDKWIALFYLPLWWIYELYFLLLHRADVIHACDFDTLMPSIISKVIKRSKLFYTIYDFYADNIPQLPEFVRKTIAYLEKKGINYSDILFLVDESRYEQVKEAKINKIFYIYNSPPDYKYIPSVTKNENFTLFYAGLLDESRGLKYVIESVKELKFIRLIIAGEGNYSQEIITAANINKNIEYLGWIRHKEVLKMSHQADVLFAFYDPSIPNNRYASPNKLFESMMCGKPIIINSETSASKLVQNEKCGIIVDYGNIQHIKKALITIYQNPDLREKLGKNGRNAYETKYSWKIMVKRLIDAYRG